MIVINTQKRIAADILKCGKNKVWFDPEQKEEIKKAITRADVRRLIKKGYIKKKKTNQQSRSRARKITLQKKRGRRSGPGKRKGKLHIGKTEWIKSIRALRKYLKEQRDTKKITSSQYRRLYLMAKGGRFRNKAHLKLYIKEMKKHEESAS